MTEDKEKIIKEAQKIVADAHKLWADFVWEQTKDWTNEQRWLLFARSANSIWSSVYHPTVKEVMTKSAEEL